MVVVVYMVAALVGFRGSSACFSLAVSSDIDDGFSL